MRFDRLGVLGCPQVAIEQALVLPYDGPHPDRDATTTQRLVHPWGAHPGEIGSKPEESGADFTLKTANPPSEQGKSTGSTPPSRT